MSMKAVNVLQTVRVADGGNIHGREIVKGTEDEVPEELFEGLEKAGYVEAVGRKKGKAALPDDGPTIAEYIAAGYPAASYPPVGYTSRSTEEEIATAVKAEEDAAAKAKADEKAAKALAKKRDAMLADLAVLSDDDLAKIVETE
ncbi:hypothetical protein EN818_30770, partial [Mesorhizobium sp. M3A.F.Ca.ET.175.01.1.1]|uniref:hypothetical protein n=1 Tax=Mesorhizobium sp. M3A.F.Ca.ET.175.01.1.1 TaxID=2563945 RepID=UPI001093A5E4